MAFSRCWNSAISYSNFLFLLYNSLILLSLFWLAWICIYILSYRSIKPNSLFYFDLWLRTISAIFLVSAASNDDPVPNIFDTDADDIFCSDFIYFYCKAAMFNICYSYKFIFYCNYCIFNWFYCNSEVYVINFYSSF